MLWNTSLLPMQHPTSMTSVQYMKKSTKAKTYKTLPRHRDQLGVDSHQDDLENGSLGIAQMQKLMPRDNVSADDEQ